MQGYAPLRTSILSILFTMFLFVSATAHAQLTCALPEGTPCKKKTDNSLEKKVNNYLKAWNSKIAQCNKLEVKAEAIDEKYQGKHTVLLAQLAEAIFHCQTGGGILFGERTVPPMAGLVANFLGGDDDDDDGDPDTQYWCNRVEKLQQKEVKLLTKWDAANDKHQVKVDNCHAQEDQKHARYDEAVCLDEYYHTVLLCPEV